MERFQYHRAVSAADAIRTMRAGGGLPTGPASERGTPAQYIAGGTNLTDYMTLNVLTPAALIDIGPLRQGYAQIEVSPERLRLGALVRMAEAEDHAEIRAHYPLLQESLALAASRQIRNMATLGGNVLQRTRCEYFRETSWPCNKRTPGAGCAALEGVNREHAILGTSPHCIAAYPGDFAQTLIALDASLQILNTRGTHRTLPFRDLHRLPGDTPHLETTLEPGELITFIDVPAGPWTTRSRYVKVRDRDSYQFALASAAVALHLEEGRVREARIALGGVASVPWRAREAEEVLRDHRLDETRAREAAAAAFGSATPRAHNAFKRELGERTLVRALLETATLEIADEHRRAHPKR